jgi:hypothetical protein
MKSKVSAKPDEFNQTFKNVHKAIVEHIHPYVEVKVENIGEKVVSPKAEDNFNPLDECEGCVYKIYATKSCPPETVISKGKIRSLIQELEDELNGKDTLQERRRVRAKLEVLRGLLEKNKEVKP